MHPIFDVPPNWSSPVQHSTEHTSSLTTSYTGAEQRASIRSTPLERVTFAVDALDDDEQLRLQAMLLGAQSKLIYVPMWHLAYPLPADLPAGSTELPVDTFDFAGCDLAYIYESDANREPVTITGQGAALTVLPTAHAYPPGSIVVPLRIARLESAASLSTGSIVTTGSLTFTLE